MISALNKSLILCINKDVHSVAPERLIRGKATGQDGVVGITLNCQDAVTGEVHNIQGVKFSDGQYEPPISQIKARWGDSVAGVYSTIGNNDGVNGVSATEFTVPAQSPKPLDKGIVVSNQIGGSFVSVTSMLLVSEVENEYKE